MNARGLHCTAFDQRRARFLGDATESDGPGPFPVERAGVLSDSTRPAQHPPFETAPRVEDGATRRSAAARDLFIGLPGILSLCDLLFDRTQIRQQLLAEKVVENLL
jgi:hypothetical protein